MGLFTITKKEDKSAVIQSMQSGLGRAGISHLQTMPAPPKLEPIGKAEPKAEPQGKKGPPDPRISELTSDLNNQSSRLRTLEERYILLRRKTQVTEQNMLSHYKKASADIKTSISRIQELRNELREIKEKMSLIEKEVEQCAKKHELALLQKYVNYWNPAEFVTKEEAKRIIEEKIRDIKPLQI